MTDLFFTYTVVDELPHGLAAARRLDDVTGEVLTYISRAATMEQVAVELGVIGTQHSDLYDRMVLQVRRPVAS